MKRTSFWSMALLGSLLTASCQKSADHETVVVGGGGGPEASMYLLAAEPAGAKGVLDVKQAAKDDDDVVVVGRVGGSAVPLVKGRASFTIVDPSLRSCSDIEGDNCPTPWDYCCESPGRRARATVLIKFVDADGRTLEQDAGETFGIKPLQTVVVRGRAKRDVDGNVTILASALHIRETKP